MLATAEECAVEIGGENEDESAAPLSYSFGCVAWRTPSTRGRLSRRSSPVNLEAGTGRHTRLQLAMTLSVARGLVALAPPAPLGIRARISQVRSAVFMVTVIE